MITPERAARFETTGKRVADRIKQRAGEDLRFLWDISPEMYDVEVIQTPNLLNDKCVRQIGFDLSREELVEAPEGIRVILKEIFGVQESDLRSVVTLDEQDKEKKDKKRWLFTWGITPVGSFEADGAAQCSMELTSRDSRWLVARIRAKEKQTK